MEIIGYIGVVCSVIGTIANVKKAWWCFVFWFAANILMAVHNWQNSDWLQMSLFLFFEVMCVVGAVKWIRDAKKEKD